MKEYYCNAISELLQGISDIQTLNRLYGLVMETWLHEKEQKNG